VLFVDRSVRISAALEDWHSAHNSQPKTPDSAEVI
jgi:hypothetical protein